MSYYDGGASSALRQRNIARRVRHTASLVSGHDKIRERQGRNWAADCKNRIIIWRATHPFKEGDVLLTDDEVLWLTIHEAAHLVMSAHWEIPKPPEVDNSHRFFRFWNAVEDIRIERWAVSRFPGKAHLCKQLHQDINEAYKEFIKTPNDPGTHIADQVGRAFLQMENETEVYGTERATQFAYKHWDQISEIAGTSVTSIEVAKRILPIYKELMDEMTEEERCRGNDEEDIEMDFDDVLRLLGWDGLLEGLARDADDDEVRRRITIKFQNEKQRQELAERLAEHSIGREASGIEGSSDDWAISKRDNRGPINVLCTRMIGRLAHNSADHWQNGLKRGQFNPAAAHKSMSGDMKAFRRKSAVGRSDYDFCITIDMSGSQGGRETQLLASCVTASEAIEKAGMGLSIITWDDGMRHYKSWHSTIKMSQGIIGYDLAHSGGGTYEGYALRVAEEMIRPRLAMGRQVFLITMTDGETNAVEESVEILGDLEARGVNTIGVGVMHPAPSHYKTQITVDTSEELASILPNLLRSLVKRG